jgi:hypothetical protein
LINKPLDKNQWRAEYINAGTIRPSQETIDAYMRLHGHDLVQHIEDSVEIQYQDYLSKYKAL